MTLLIIHTEIKKWILLNSQEGFLDYLPTNISSDLKEAKEAWRILAINSRSKSTVEKAQLYVFSDKLIKCIDKGG